MTGVLLSVIKAGSTLYLGILLVLTQLAMLYPYCQNLKKQI